MLAQAPKRAFAIGGAWRSLARLHMRQTGYPLHVMHHYAIDADEAADFYRMVAAPRYRFARFDRSRVA